MIRVPKSWLDRIKRDVDERDGRVQAILAPHDNGLNRRQQALVKKRMRRS